jgi:hypothetical protein
MDANELRLRRRADKLDERLTELEDKIEGLIESIAAVSRRLDAVEEKVLGARRPKTGPCDGQHAGHPCDDPDCWVLARYKEQHMITPKDMREALAEALVQLKTEER